MAPQIKKAFGLASSVVLAGCSVVGYRGGTPTPDFSVVEQLGPVEIRHYSERLAAQTVVETADPERARQAGFKRLAGYIFGDNRAGRKIAMTAPVAQSADPVPGSAPARQGWRIRFFLPREITLSSAPRPDDRRIALEPLASADYAVLRFSNSRDPDAVAEHVARLRARLADSRWQAEGAPVAWFYDPPWTLWFLRRNEVALPVTLREGASSSTDTATAQ